MKNLLVIGLGSKPELLDVQRGFLFIDDHVPDFPKATVFDPARDSFNPLKGMNEKTAVEFVETVYGAEGESTLTVRNGKRALSKLLLKASALDTLRPNKSDADKEAAAVIDDLLFLPVLRKALCREPRFSFRSRPIFARLNRAEIGDKAAFILGSLLIQQFKGQIIIPDFGFYARPFHTSLIRENRLMAGVHTLSELEPRMRQMCLLMPKVGKQCTYDDAEMLARYRGYVPSTNEYNAFVEDAMAG